MNMLAGPMQQNRLGTKEFCASMHVADAWEP